MLVVSRHPGERIVVGNPPNQIIITLVEMRCYQKKCRIGIDADPSVPIHREEVALAIQRGEVKGAD